MPIHTPIRHPKPATYSRKVTPFIDRDFQIRYTILIVGASMVGMALVLLPIYYFINQNYQIFVDLAYEHSPNILRYLEREKIWINTILFAVVCGNLLFFSLIGFRMTNRIVGPIMVLRNHIKQLSRGRWSIGPVRVRSSDEFQELVDSYNYFYRAFHANAEQELEKLERLAIDPSNKESFSIWETLINEKRAQLGRPPLQQEEVSTLSDAVDDADPALHRVS